MAALREGRFEEVEVGTIDLRGTDGEIVPAIHARPEGMPRRGLVLHPDIMGIRPLFEDLCRRLATHGIAVCAPEPFARFDVTDVDPMGRMQLVASMEDELQIGDLERAADHLVVHDDVSDVAVLGFCMGGMYALKAAATGRFDRAVAFYGMIRVPEGWRGDALAEPLATAAATVCPTLAIFGDADPYTPAGRHRRAPGRVGGPGRLRDRRLRRTRSTASCTTPTGPRTAPTTRPTPGPVPSPSSASTDRPIDGNPSRSAAEVSA